MERVVKKIYSIVIISSLWSISCLYTMEEVKLDLVKIRRDEQLFNAVGKEDIEQCKILLQEGADPNEEYNRNERDAHFRVATSLHLAVNRCNAEIVSILLATKADPNVTDLYGRTPLHWTGLCCLHSGIITLLIKAGAHKYAVDMDGNTPLHRHAAGHDWCCKNILCQPPVTMTSEIYSRLLAFLCACKFSTNKCIKKLPKDMILYNLFPYICPWFPFTDALVGNLQLRQAKRLLLIKNNKGETASKSALKRGWYFPSSPRDTAAICDPGKVEQHRWLIEKNIRTLNPCLKQIEQE